MKLLLLVLVLLFTACSKPPATSCAGLEVREAWVREMPPGVSISAGYMQLNNSSEQDIVISAFSSPEFARVELHENREENGQRQMRKMEFLVVPATEGLDLQPGGWHLMLFDPVNSLTAGQTLSLKLHCEQDVLSTTAEVRKAGPSHHEQHAHH